MESNTYIEEILAEVLQSKKYRFIYPFTIRRIIEDLSKKVDRKKLEKETKTKLHQLWGAYFTRPNFSKLLKKLKVSKDSNIPVKEVFQDLLKLQSSTNERLPILDDFYKKVFEVTGKPSVVVDYGCGLNPLTIPWMGADINYTGVDIDSDAGAFLNITLGLFSAELNQSNQNATVILGDVFEEKFIKSDVTFLFKILPLIETQQKGFSLKMLEKIPSDYIVVSFPTKSISGIEKGMRKNYENDLKEMLSRKKWEVSKLEFSTELVFIIKKNA